MDRYKGACHCGAVRFSVTHTLVELTTCDCSLCAKRNAVMTAVPEKALVVDADHDALRTYRWNSQVAEHHFCGRCGVYVFHRKRAMPDHYGVNIFCLEGVDRSALSVRATSGADMTVVCDDPLDAWPGPRAASGAKGVTTSALPGSPDAGSVP